MATVLFKDFRTRKINLFIVESNKYDLKNKHDRQLHQYTTDLSVKLMEHMKKRYETLFGVKGNRAFGDKYILDNFSLNVCDDDSEYTQDGYCMLFAYLLLDYFYDSFSTIYDHNNTNVLEHCTVPDMTVFLRRVQEVLYEFLQKKKGKGKGLDKNKLKLFTNNYVFHILEPLYSENTSLNYPFYNYISLKSIMKKGDDVIEVFGNYALNRDICLTCFGFNMTNVKVFTVPQSENGIEYYISESILKKPGDAQTLSFKSITRSNKTLTMYTDHLDVIIGKNKTTLSYNDVHVLFFNLKKFAEHDSRQVQDNTTSPKPKRQKVTPSAHALTPTPSAHDTTMTPTLTTSAHDDPTLTQVDTTLTPQVDTTLTLDTTMTQDNTLTLTTTAHDSSMTDSQIDATDNDNDSIEDTMVYEQDTNVYWFRKFSLPNFNNFTSNFTSNNFISNFIDQTCTVSYGTNSQWYMSSTVS